MLREKEVFGLLQKHLGDSVYNGEKLETSPVSTEGNL